MSEHFDVRVVKAWDWFKITGRGIVVSVDVPATDGIRSGDHVRFDLAPNGQGTPGLITEDATYRVSGIEESRCLVHHADGKQCVMGRGLAVTAVSP
jgi:hypothetical protein